MASQIGVLVSDASVDRNTLTNAQDLIKVLAQQSTVPNEIGKGYWNTVAISWPGWEIEIFPDRYELYHFHGAGTDITEYSRNPQEPIPQPFLDDILKFARK